MMKSVVKAIGEEAISKEEPMLILFDESATNELKKFSIIQSFEEKNGEPLKEGSKIKFDDKEYTITQVGPVANEYLKSMGHVTVVFKEAPKEDALINSLYVTPTELPDINVGTVITFGA